MAKKSAKSLEHEKKEYRNSKKSKSTKSATYVNPTTSEHTQSSANYANNEDSWSNITAYGSGTSTRGTQIPRSTTEYDFQLQKWIYEGDSTNMPLAERLERKNWEKQT
ncbi:hypothetical protein EG329_005031 [Mollisiaceae sp. DMI_Dod_QoI]|nr:hypothetical protein EG329_005031 [Helotiales sp. DMI_Dod_QoI]